MVEMGRYGTGRDGTGWGGPESGYGSMLKSEGRGDLIFENWFDMRTGCKAYSYSLNT